MKVKLSDFELKLARALAADRIKGTQTLGLEDRKADKNRTNQQIGEDGVRGELAFCKIMNVYPELNGIGLGAGDCRLRDGRIFDVKCVQPGRNMVATHDKDKERKRVDGYVLMYDHGEGVVEFIGWCHYDQLICEQALADGAFMYKPGYFLNRSKLYRDLP